MKAGKTIALSVLGAALCLLGCDSADVSDIAADATPAPIAHTCESIDDFRAKQAHVETVLADAIQDGVFSPEEKQAIYHTYDVLRVCKREGCYKKTHIEVRSYEDICRREAEVKARYFRDIPAAIEITTQFDPSGADAYADLSPEKQAVWDAHYHRLATNLIENAAMGLAQAPWDEVDIGMGQLREACPAYRGTVNVYQAYLGIVRSIDAPAGDLAGRLAWLDRAETILLEMAVEADGTPDELILARDMMTQIPLIRASVMLNEKQGTTLDGAHRRMIFCNGVTMDSSAATSWWIQNRFDEQTPQPVRSIFACSVSPKRIFWNQQTADMGKLATAGVSWATLNEIVGRHHRMDTGPWVAERIAALPVEGQATPEDMAPLSIAGLTRDAKAIPALEAYRTRIEQKGEQDFFDETRLELIARALDAIRGETPYGFSPAGRHHHAMDRW